MRRRGFDLPYWALSALAHAALALAIVNLAPHEEPPSEPVRIVLRDVAPPPPPPPPLPEPEVVPETPSAPEPVQAPVAKAKPSPSKPAKAEPAPVQAPSAADVPLDFGVALSNGNGPGLAVPVGDPGGGSSGASVRSQQKAKAPAKVLGPAKPANPEVCAQADTKAQALELPQPGYSEAARQAQIAGKVRVELSLDATGQVSDVKIIEGLHPDLDRSTQETLRKAKFAPATRCGKAVASTLKIAIRFTL